MNALKDIQQCPALVNELDVETNYLRSSVQNLNEEMTIKTVF
jgi:hypothetical protein